MKNGIKNNRLPERKTGICFITQKLFTMTIFLNMRTSYGVETVDEFTREPNQSPKEFRAYVSKMVQEYHLSGHPVYRSSRPTKEWRNK